MKKTIASHIINTKKWNGYKFVSYGEGIVKILKENGHHFLALYDTKKDALIWENDMNSENIHFFFRKALTICQVIVSFEEGQYGMEFDKNSFASFNQFEKDILKITNTKLIEVPYKSTNLRFTGECRDGKLNGQVWEFYDTVNLVVKSNCEYEDGLHDGTGTFISFDGLVKVTINNISSGEPIDCGVLTIENVGTYDVDFSEFPEGKFDLHDDDFCYKLAEHIVPNVKNRLFKHLTKDDQINWLLERVNSLTLQVNQLANKKGPLTFW